MTLVLRGLCIADSRTGIEPRSAKKTIGSADSFFCLRRIFVKIGRNVQIGIDLSDNLYYNLIIN